MLLLAQEDTPVGQTLRSALAEVERRFTTELLSDLDPVNRLVHHVDRYRGKMLRPTLVLATALALDPPRGDLSDDLLSLATVVEMVHMATLVHDDVLDEAEMRRRGATINHLAGNEAAVMLGDYLISHAYHLCSSIPTQTRDGESIARLIARATNTVCEGELLQLANRGNFELNERTYFEIVRRKTASLCGTCCHAAALLTDSTASHQADDTASLYGYGEKLGIAFQITDDLLDLTGDPATVGKTLGRDMEKGKLTLPLIRYLAVADDRERAATLEVIRGSAFDGGEAVGAVGAVGGGGVRIVDEDAVAEVVDRVQSSDAIDYAQAWCRRLVEDAKGVALDGLPPSPARKLLLDTADAVVERRR